MVITFEFPHLLRLIEGNQFDTIYHEHFSYFSFLAVEKIFAKHGLILSRRRGGPNAWWFSADLCPTPGQ